MTIAFFGSLGRDAEAKTSKTTTIRTAESDAAYPNIRLNARWRVVRCRADVQWILQYRASAETYSREVWPGRSYCQTREALIRCCNAHAGTIDATALVALLRLPAQNGIKVSCKAPVSS